jgi:hypothetical protein
LLSSRHCSKAHTQSVAASWTPGTACTQHILQLWNSSTILSRFRWSQDSSLVMVTGYGMDGWDSFPSNANAFLPHDIMLN